MIETKIQQLSVNEIMKKIKNEVKLTEVLSEENSFMKKKLYHVDDFYKYDDIEFIRWIYIGLLKREPDTKGMESHLSTLRKENQTKENILKSIYYSEEALAFNVNVLGLLKKQTNIQKGVTAILSKMNHLTKRETCE